jgi:ankyrin repeat protein
LLDNDDADGIEAPVNIETLRAEFAVVVEERRRRAAEINSALWNADDADVMSAQAAIAAGADVNYSVGSFSCLTIASTQGYAKIVALLLNAGANKEAKDHNGATALFAAATKGHAECIDMLLNAGADVNATNDDKTTALMMAAANGHLQCIEHLFISAGCDVNARNTHRGSALGLALRENHVDCACALIRARADITVTVRGQTIEDFANKTDNSDELKAAIAEESRRLAEAKRAAAAAEERARTQLAAQAAKAAKKAAKAAAHAAKLAAEKKEKEIPRRREATREPSKSCRRAGGEAKSTRQETTSQT